MLTIWVLRPRSRTSMKNTLFERFWRADRCSSQQHYVSCRRFRLCFSYVNSIHDDEVSCNRIHMQGTENHGAWYSRRPSYVFRPTIQTSLVAVFANWRSDSFSFLFIGYLSFASSWRIQNLLQDRSWSILSSKHVFKSCVTIGKSRITLLEMTIPLCFAFFDESISIKRQFLYENRPVRRTERDQVNLGQSELGQSRRPDWKTFV